MSRYTTSLTVLSANEESSEPFLLGFEHKRLKFGLCVVRLITACVLLLPPKCYVMPVTMRGEIGRVFVTKYNLRCKHYVRCLQILKERYSRMRSYLFHMLHAVTCYSTWYLYILNLKRFCITFGTVGVIMVSFRALSCCFYWTGNERNKVELHAPWLHWLVVYRNFSPFPIQQGSLNNGYHLRVQRGVFVGCSVPNALRILRTVSADFYSG